MDVARVEYDTDKKTKKSDADLAKEMNKKASERLKARLEAEKKLKEQQANVTNVPKVPKVPKNETK